MGDLSLELAFAGHRVRMVGTAEEPLWVAKDVCRVLGLRDHSNISHVVPENERGVVQLTTPGGPQPYACVREGGLYRLISRSRAPEAQRFQRWLFNEVLPSIRVHGCWPPPERAAIGFNPHEPRQLAALALELTGIVQEQQAQIAVLAPKAQVYDDCMSSADVLTVAQVANIVARPHRPMGEGRLFSFLREQKILQDDNRPYQEHIEEGRFIVRETTWKTAGGHAHVRTQPLVTQKGVDYIRRRIDAYIGQGSLLPGRALPPAGH